MLNMRYNGGMTFTKGGIRVLHNLSIVAKEFKPLIAEWMDIFERDLTATNEAHIEKVRRANFIVRNKAIDIDDYYPQYGKLYFNVHSMPFASVELNFAKGTVGCTCTEDAPCHHGVASVMWLYQYHHSLQRWVTNWRAKKTVQFELLSEERSPAVWRHLTKSIIGQTLPNDYIEPFLLSSFDTKIHDRLQQHMPFEHEWQTLYQLYTELYVLNTLWQHIDEPHETHGLMFTYYLARKQEKISMLLNKLSARTRLFEMDAFFTDIEQMLRSLLFECNGYHTERFSIYCEYWQLVQQQKKAREQELQTLKAIRLQDTTFAQLFFATVLGQRDIIFAVTRIETAECGYYIELAKIAATLQQDAEAHLLKLVLPHIEQYVHQFVVSSLRNSFIEQLMHLYEDISLTEAEENQLYASLGAYGLQFYSLYLIRKMRYRDWIALQMLRPSSLGHAEMYGLKDVLAHDPSLVLPLYHTFALREVEQKSRMHYKQAVRIWKMMKSAAKKANKEAYFERYIETMQHQFKRLRALQEEMEKGKLLT